MNPFYRNYQQQLNKNKIRNYKQLQITKYWDHLVHQVKGWLDLCKALRILELLKVTGAQTDLKPDEVNILTGALVLQEKKVEDIMTPLGDCYMLALQAVLDFDTISEIKDKGYSRIPNAS